MQNLRDLFDKALHLVQETGEILKKPLDNKGAEVKDDNSFVTKYDLMVDEKLSRELKELTDCSVYSEEHVEKEKDKYFIIDPIDGTHNFNAGWESFAIALAYVENGEALFSIIHFPLLNKTFTAIKNEGAYLNGERIFVRTKRPQRLIGTCEVTEDGLPIINKILSNEEKIDLRSIYCSAQEMCYVANGIFDFCIYGRMKGLWDLVPPQLIIEEAGGIVKAKKNEDNTYRIIAGSPEAAEKMEEIIGGDEKF